MENKDTRMFYFFRLKQLEMQGPQQRAITGNIIDLISGAGDYKLTVVEGNYIWPKLVVCRPKNKYYNRQSSSFRGFLVLPVLLTAPDEIHAMLYLSLGDDLIVAKNASQNTTVMDIIEEQQKIVEAQFEKESGHPSLTDILLDSLFK